MVQVCLDGSQINVQRLPLRGKAKEFNLNNENDCPIVVEALPRSHEPKSTLTNRWCIWYCRTKQAIIGIDNKQLQNVADMDRSIDDLSEIDQNCWSAGDFFATNKLWTSCKSGHHVRLHSCDGFRWQTHHAQAWLVGGIQRSSEDQLLQGCPWHALGQELAEDHQEHRAINPRLSVMSSALPIIVVDRDSSSSMMLEHGNYVGITAYIHYFMINNG